MLAGVSDNLEHVVLSITKIRYDLAGVKSSLCFFQSPFGNLNCFTSRVTDQVDTVVNRLNVVTYRKHLFSTARPYFVLLLHQSVKLVLQMFEQTGIP